MEKIFCHKFTFLPHFQSQDEMLLVGWSEPDLRSSPRKALKSWLPSISCFLFQISASIHLAVPFSFPVNLRPLSILFDLKIVWNLIYLCFLFSCLIVPTNRPPSTHLLTGRTNENPFWTSKHWIVIYNVKKTPTGKAGLRWFFNQNLKRLTSFLPLLGWIIIFFLFLFERALFEGDVWTNIKNICWTNKGSLPSPIF